MNRARFAKVLVFGLFMASTATVGVYLFQHRQLGLPPGFASGNGRLEATEVDVATKIAGRLALIQRNDRVSGHLLLYKKQRR